MKHLYEQGDLSAEIIFTFTPGRPARGPSYASGGEPAEGPEIDVEEIWLLGIDGKRVVEINGLLKGHADFLALFGKHIEDRLIASAEDDVADAREAAAEARHEQAREDRMIRDIEEAP